MPDFVKQGEKVETKGITETLVQTPAIVEEEQEERKSLYEQLKEDKERKQEQFRAQFDSQNTGYKLDEKSAKFYEQLLHKKQQEELSQKLFEKNEIIRFKQLKQEKTIGLPCKTIAIPNKSNKIIKKSLKKVASKKIEKENSVEQNIAKIEANHNNVVGDYSSDESDE